MKVYEFGTGDAPTLLLIPGTCCHWQTNFGRVIPLLEDAFHLLCASYDGFDETEDTVFPTVTEECEKLEDYICRHHDGRVYAAYGCSLGGSLVGLLVQRRRIHITHAILGSSDLDQNAPFPAMLKSRLISGILSKMIRTGRLPGFLQRQMEHNPSEDMAYYKKLLDSFGIDDPKMKFIRKESIYNQFYSDLVTPLETGISVPGTTVHIFYALKMGEKYEARYLRHFAEPDILRQNYQHEELLFCYPNEWTQRLREVCSVKGTGCFCCKK